MPAEFDGHPMDVIAARRHVRLPRTRTTRTRAFLWYHDHAHGRTARTLYYGLVGTYLLARRPRGGARPAAGRVRRAAGHPRPRVQQGRLVPLRRERRPRLPRRHDPRQRRGRAADARRAADLPAPAPQRLQRALLRAAARAGPPDHADRERRRAARAAGRAAASPAPPRRADRARWSTSARFRPGSELVLQNEAGEATTNAVMRFDVVRGGGARRRDPQGPDAHARAAAGAQREPPLGPRAGYGQRRAVADRRPRVRPDARRRPAAARHARELWQWHNPSQPRPPDAPARDALPDRRAHTRRRAPGRAGLEGHDRRAAGRDGHGAAVVRAVHGPLRVPLPRPGARRQGDDAAAGGGRHEAPDRCCSAPALALVAAAPPARRGRGPRSTALDSLRSGTSRPSRSRPATRVTWTFAGTTQATTCVARAPNWSSVDARPPAGAAATFTFTAAGHLRFVCQFHQDTMRGDVIVGNAPRRRPRRRSASSRSPTTRRSPRPCSRSGGLDTTRRAARDVALDALGRRREAAVPRLRAVARSPCGFVRAGKRVRTQARHGRAQARSPSARACTAGRYRIDLRARDLAGNALARRATSRRHRPAERPRAAEPRPRRRRTPDVLRYHVLRREQRLPGDAGRGLPLLRRRPQPRGDHAAVPRLPRAHAAADRDARRAR